LAVRRTRIAIGFVFLSLWAVSTAVCAQEFDALTLEQQVLLAPLAENWNRIPAARRERLAEMADRVAVKPPREQERFRRGLHRFLLLKSDQRHRVRELFERFRHLPPGERQEIIDRVMTMSDEERHAFALGMRVADRTHRIGSRIEDYLRSLPPEQRRDLLSELKDLSPPDKLRRIADEMEAGRQEPEQSGE
jgi:hypothetical protein